MIEQNSSVWDYDLIISRDPSKLYPIDLSKRGTFRLYTDYEKGIKYAKISKQDSNYNSIKMEAKRYGIDIEEIGEELFLKINVPLEQERKAQVRGRDISKIPGVLKDPFSLWLLGREYFRFKLIKESLNEVSNTLFKALELMKKEGENYWKIEYIGEHNDDISYLRKYNYPRRVINVTAREIDSENKMNFFPHYSSRHLLFFILGEDNRKQERAIRFSEEETQIGGIIKESQLLRNGDVKIYEDIRNITSFSISSLSREPFAAFPISIYQFFDGEKIFLNWWIDEDDLNFLLKRIKKFNESNKNQVELILNKIEYLY